jgi:hypothetical protein
MGDDRDAQRLVPAGNATNVLLDQRFMFPFAWPSVNLCDPTRSARAYR